MRMESYRLQMTSSHELTFKRLVSEGTLSCKEVELAVLKEICCGARLGTSLHCTFAGFENSEQYQSKAPH